LRGAAQPVPKKIRLPGLIALRACSALTSFEPTSAAARLTDPLILLVPTRSSCSLRTVEGDRALPYAINRYSRIATYAKCLPAKAKDSTPSQVVLGSVYSGRQPPGPTFATVADAQQFICWSCQTPAPSAPFVKEYVADSI
jgi:hypothetical protein